MGIREREAKSIAERKKTLAVKLANVAELGVERMEEMIGNESLHDATFNHVSECRSRGKIVRPSVSVES